MPIISNCWNVLKVWRLSRNPWNVSSINWALFVRTSFSPWRVGVKEKKSFHSRFISAGKSSYTVTQLGESFTFWIIVWCVLWRFPLTKRGIWNSFSCTQRKVIGSHLMGIGCSFSAAAPIWEFAWKDGCLPQKSFLQVSARKDHLFIHFFLSACLAFYFLAMQCSLPQGLSLHFSPTMWGHLFRRPAHIDF